MRRKPWDQLPDEPRQAYIRFLFYLNLGPGRTLQKAYQAALASVDSAKDGKETQSISGEWGKNASEHRWAERAEQHDIEMLSTVSKKCVLKFAALIEKAVSATLDSSALEQGPETWKEVVETLNAFRDLIPPETIRRILSRRDDGADDIETNGQPASLPNGPAGLLSGRSESRPDNGTSRDLAEPCETPVQDAR